MEPSARASLRQSNASSGGCRVHPGLAGTRRGERLWQVARRCADIHRRLRAADEPLHPRGRGRADLRGFHSRGTARTTAVFRPHETRQPPRSRSSCPRAVTSDATWRIWRPSVPRDIAVLDTHSREAFFMVSLAGSLLTGLDYQFCSIAGSWPRARRSAWLLTPGATERRRPRAHSRPGWIASLAASRTRRWPTTDSGAARLAGSRR